MAAGFAILMVFAVAFRHLLAPTGESARDRGRAAQRPGESPSRT